MLQMEEKILVEATAKLIEQARENRFKEEQRRQQRESRQQTTAYHTESTTGNNTYIPVPSPAEPPEENQVPVPPASEFLPEEYGSQPVLPENIPPFTPEDAAASLPAADITPSSGIIPSLHFLYTSGRE